MGNPAEDHTDRLGGRLPLLAPADLDEEQQQVYDALTRTVVPEAAESGFTARLDDGRFIGPFNAMLRVPRIAAGLGQWTGQIARSGLAADVRQVVILTVGAAWSAEYEIDAHTSAARVTGVRDEAITAILQGRRPPALSEEADVAHRLTISLLDDHVVPDGLYREATAAFGEAGVIAILCLIGQYQLISSILVSFQVPVPDRHDPSRATVTASRPGAPPTPKPMTTEIVAPEHGEIGTLAIRRREIPAPGPQQVLVAVRAVGVNPTDEKSADRSWPRTSPMLLGFEAAGVVTALGIGVATEHSIAVGDEVVAYPILGGYASDILVPAGDVLPKPPTLGFPQAANLLLVGTTAAEMLEVTGVRSGETILVHGASGATGVSLLQQAARLPVRIIATASERNADLVRSFGAEPVTYGPGLEQRVRTAAPQGIDAALDCVGTDEALDVSLVLVAARTRIVSIVNRERARELGVRFIDGTNLSSFAYRNAQRHRLIQMAADSALDVPMAGTLPLTVPGVHEAFAALRSGHPGGKLALIPSQPAGQWTVSVNG